MRFRQTGKLTDDFYVLGNSGNPVYLLDGPSPVLFDSGFTALALAYEKDIRGVLKGRSPAYLLITHSHFDHVGAAAYLKRAWPEMTIAGSAGLQTVLSRPRALELIQALNEKARRMLPSWGVKEIHEGPFEAFKLDRVLSPGERLDLGGRTEAVALATPGHTRDFMSYWVPRRGILVASEAAGCDDGSGRVWAEFLVDYGDYRRSLETLSRMGAEVLCQGHHMVLTHEHVDDHFGRSLAQAEAYVSWVTEILRAEGGDVNRTLAKMKAEEWDPKPSPKQMEEAYVLNTMARVRNVWQRMQRGEES